MGLSLTLILAVLMDAVVGEPRWLWKRVSHPVVIVGWLIARLEEKLNTGHRGGGVLLTAILVMMSGGLGLALSQLGAIVEILVIAILVAQRSLVEHVSMVERDLRLSLPSARKSVAMIVSRDTSQMDRSEISRAALESGAENLSDGVIAPIFWALVGGLPGIMIYKAVNTADSMIGYRTPRYEKFGWASARLDDVMNWIPARGTALGFWLVGGMHGKWSEIKADADRHKSPNAGWPEAALSRSLGVALAGPRTYHGNRQDLPWVNHTGRRDIGATEIETGVRHLWRVWALTVMVLVIGLIF